ncbi:hypothetical protein R6Q57_011517 [Mikania cordata]
MLVKEDLRCSELSDFIHMDSEDESDPLFDHENETKDDDDYMYFVDDDIHDEGLEQETKVDQQKLQDEFDLDIYEFDSLIDEENDCPLKRSLRKIRRKKKMNRDSVNEPFFVRQCFNSREQLRLLVKKLAVDSRRQLKICRNDPNIFRVMCEGSNLEFKEGTTEGSNDKQLVAAPLGSSRIIWSSSGTSSGSGDSSIVLKKIQLLEFSGFDPPRYIQMENLNFGKHSTTDDLEKDVEECFPLQCLNLFGPFTGKATNILG